MLFHSSPYGAPSLNSNKPYKRSLLGLCASELLVHFAWITRLFWSDWWITWSWSWWESVNQIGKLEYVVDSSSVHALHKSEKQMSQLSHNLSQQVIWPWSMIRDMSQGSRGIFFSGGQDGQFSHCLQQHGQSMYDYIRSLSSLFLSHLLFIGQTIHY